MLDTVHSWTPGDVLTWPDPRDRRHPPLPSPAAEWDRGIDRRKASSWTDDRSLDLPVPHHLARPWDREIRDRPPPRLPPQTDAPLEGRWIREQDAYAHPHHRILPDPSAPFRPPSAAPPPLAARGYDRSFDPAVNAARYPSPVLSTGHPFHDRPPSSHSHLGLGPPPSSSADLARRRSHGRSTSGASVIEEGFSLDAPRSRQSSDHLREIREVKREPIDEPMDWRHPVAKHPTGSSLSGSMTTVLPPLAPTRSVSNGFPVPASPYNSAVPPSPRYQLPPVGHHGLPHPDNLRPITPIGAYDTHPPQTSTSPRHPLRPLSARHAFSPRISVQQHPSPNGATLAPMRAWPPETGPATGLPIRESIAPSEPEPGELRVPSPLATDRALQDDSMPLDETPAAPAPPARLEHAQPTQALSSRVSPVRDVPATAVESDITRPASDDDTHTRTPRRPATRRRGVGRNRRTSNMPTDDMEVDQEPAGLLDTPPSDQTAVSPRSAVQAYLFNNNKISPDVGVDLIEEIIAQNRALADAPITRKRTSADELVEEITSSIETHQILESYTAAVRHYLQITRIQAEDQLALHLRNLRDEYRRRNKEWKARCAELDRQVASEKEQKTPAPSTPLTEAPHSATALTFTSGRATRRTAGNLGLMADAVRSDLEFEQVMQSLGNEDLVDPNILSIRNAANVPDMLCVLPGCEPFMDVTYDDTNGDVEYPEQFYDVSTGLGDWTDDEKQVFIEQFAIFGKQFGKIADKLPHKTAEQCVLYYYISKGTLVNYRELASKGVKGRRKRPLKRSLALATGKQKGNALLTDIRTRMGEDTPADSPTGSPKQAEAELPSKRRRNGDSVTPALVDDFSRTRITRSRAYRGTSPENGVGTGARDSGEEGSSSDGGSDAGENTEQREETRKPKPRRAARKTAQQQQQPDQNDTPTATTPAPPKRKSRASSHWSTLEKATFKEQLAIHGRKWEMIAAAVRTKSAIQCKNYYVSNHKDLNLESIALAAEAKEAAELAKDDMAVDEPSEDRSVANAEEPESDYPVPAAEERQVVDSAPTIPASARSTPAYHLTSNPRRPEPIRANGIDQGPPTFERIPTAPPSPRAHYPAYPIRPPSAGPIMRGAPPYYDRPTRYDEHPRGEPPRYPPGLRTARNPYPLETANERLHWRPSPGYPRPIEPYGQHGPHANGYAEPPPPNANAPDMGRLPPIHARSFSGSQNGFAHAAAGHPSIPHHPGQDFDLPARSLANSAPPASSASGGMDPEFHEGGMRDYPYQASSMNGAKSLHASQLGGPIPPLGSRSVSELAPFGSKQAHANPAPPVPLQVLPPFGSKPNPLHTRRLSASQALYPRANDAPGGAGVKEGLSEEPKVA
ncbi:hypothetical protein FRB99_005403 [Tulasnella sp. 403]|nr:hypothetical protein FRB99_005403 [Tulasnella sp. 403]